jgi:hypothetical protein
MNESSTTTTCVNPPLTELHFAVREFAISDALRNVPIEAIRELCARKWEIRNRKVRLETKSEMRTHSGGKSPDYGDAVAFAVELARRLGAVAGAELKGEERIDYREMQREYDDMINDENTFSYSPVDALE